MKKLILFASIIGLSFTTAQAQELTQKKINPKVEHNVTKETDMLKKELSLDEKQEVLVEKKVREYAQQRHDLIASGLKKVELQKRLGDLEDKKLEEMRGVLNKDQYKHLMKIKEIRKNGLSNKRQKSKRLRSK